MTYTFKLSRRLAIAGAVVLSLATASACASADSDLSTEPGSFDTTTSKVVVSPDDITIAVAELAQFSAYGIRSSGEIIPVTLDWVASGGTVDSRGRFSAMVPGTYELIGRGRNRERPADTARVHVRETVAPVVALELSPAIVSLHPGQTQHFAVVGRRADGTVAPLSVSWQASGGTITESGLYTAGATAGNFRVVAIDPLTRLADTALVRITLPSAQLVAVELSPASVTLAPGGQQQMSVQGRMSDGSVVPITPTFTATGGTISPTGTYTAGSSTGTFRIVASVASGLADTAIVVIAAAPPPGGGPYPNEPPGMQPIAEHDFSCLPAPGCSVLGEWVSRTTPNLTLGTDPTAPRTASAISRTRFPAGLPAGIGPVSFEAWGQLQHRREYREIYFSMWVKIEGADFENQAVATKFSFFGYGEPPGGSHNQGTLWIKGTGTQAIRSAFPLAFTSKSYYKQPGQWSYQNENHHKLFTVGEWHQIEVYLNQGSLDASNGILRVWLDGVRVLNYTNKKFTDSATNFTHGFWSYVWNPTWGGNNSDVKTRDDFVDIDHIYISGR